MDLKTFVSSRYDHQRFIRFISERFYGFEELSSAETDEELNDTERRDIAGYRYLGSVDLDDAKELGFFEFRSRNTNIENKRVGYNAVLKKLADEYGLDGAIASFYHPESDAWRLSFVGFEYDAGRARVTNLKRYTYVLGEGLPVKTALMQLKQLQYPQFEDLYEIFGVERVSKEFYEKYRSLFETINRYLEENYFNYFQRDITNIHRYSKKLLGRIIFLYFIQKKGWLGVESGAKWGSGDKNFLYKQLKQAIKEGTSFHSSKLRRLFFEALNTKREDSYFEPLACRIPFLNGGLFEKDDLDQIKDIEIDNTIFERIFRTFNEYNFTIIEDSPDDKEVAIDPEMMGRVFENLLEENYRKGKGAFYTPREIVHYMCQQSIIDYLGNHFGDKSAISNLVVYKMTDNKYITDNGSKIHQKLKELKILDPAIGSGAFPMGLLHEIVSIMTALDKTLTGKEIAALKRSIIENSIYGIDIDYSAVEVAKLRFWLSLVVDEEEPIPLPNLYYKIMVGNSLLESINGFDPLLKEQRALFDSDEVKIDEIRGLLHNFYNTSDNHAKQEIKAHIERLIDEILAEKLQEQEEIIQSQLNNMSVLEGVNRRQQEHIQEAMETIGILQKIKNRPTTELFFYKIYFAEIFDKGGFDIVIGNPPYIRQEKIKELKPRLQKERYYNPLSQQIDKYECFSGTADIYIYFFEKGFKLLSPQGILSYITSNKYTRAKYGEKFRKFVLDRCAIKEFVDFNGVKVFESATVDTAILSLSHQNITDRQILYCDVGDDYKKEQNLYEYIQSHGYLYPQKALTVEGFTFSSPKALAIKERIEEVGIPLREWDISINYGIKTGLNEAFIIDSETKERLIKEDPKSAAIIKPLLRGKDIDRYAYHFADKWLINSHNNPPIDVSKKYPAIYEWLLQFKEKLEKRSDKGKNWWNLRNCAYLEEFEKEKIVWQRVTKKPTFCLVDQETYILDSMAFITSNYNKYLLSILNSVLMHYYIDKTTHQYGTTGYLLSNQFVERLPIPNVGEKTKKLFEVIVNYIIDLKKRKNPKSEFFERVIDVMVYELYFEKELKEQGFGIIEIVAKDLEENKDADDLFKRWSDSKHPVKYNVDNIDSVEVVKLVVSAL